MARKLIPFGMLPASWGLKGKSRALAEAEYLYEGEELERALLKIHWPDESSDAFKRGAIDLDLKYLHISELQADERHAALTFPSDSPHDQLGRMDVQRKHGHITDYQYDVQNAKLREAEHGDAKLVERQLLEIELKHGNITQYEHDLQRVDMDFPDEDSLEYQLGRLAVEHKHEKVTDREMRKLTATIRSEPWFEVLDVNFHHKDVIGSGLTFELDWNEFHVQWLIEQGFSGRNDEEIVDVWFTQACAEMFQVFEEQEADNIVPITSANRTRRTKLDDGRGEYS